MPRVIKILLLVTVALVAVSVLFLYLQTPSHNTPFADATSKAEKIVFEQGGAKVELDKQGKDWQVRTDQGGFYPAERDKIHTLLTALPEVQIEDEITTHSERAADYEVNAASGMRVTLLNAKGTPLADGIFGKQAPDFTHIYFRFTDKPAVYLARNLIRGELGGGATVSAWRSRDLVSIPEAQIQTISIENKGSKLDLVRSSDTWTRNGEKVDPAPVFALVGALSHLRADDFVETQSSDSLTYGSLDFGQIQLTSPDTTVTLHIGKPDKARHRFPVSISKEAGLAWVSESQMNLLLKKPTDFHAITSQPIAPLPTPPKPVPVPH